MGNYEAKMAAYLKKQPLLQTGDRVLLGCSGGIDSLVLLHYLKAHEIQYGIAVEAVHVNHMLRGEESVADRLFTEETCRSWQIPCSSRDIPIPDLWQAAGGNKQQICRNERYAYFEEVMEKTGAEKVATAHHADDQLETLLMSGLRGSLGSGAVGMPARRRFGKGELVRPQLGVSKTDIADYAARHGIVHREDSSNAETVYTRNRIRQSIIPLMKEENSAAAEQFAAFADEIQQDRRFIEALAAEKIAGMVIQEGNGIRISAESFRREALALQKRMVLILLNYLYNGQHVSITRQLAEKVQEVLLHPEGTVHLHLPQNYRMIREYDTVRFFRETEKSPVHAETAVISQEWSKKVKGFRYKAVPLTEVPQTDDAVFWYFSAPAEGRLVIRNRKPGDRIRLKGMDQPKKVARLMIDEKVPAPERDDWPVIAAETDEVVLIPGLRPSSFFSRRKRAEDDWILLEQRV